MSKGRSNNLDERIARLWEAIAFVAFCYQHRMMSFQRMCDEDCYWDGGAWVK